MRSLVCSGVAGRRGSLTVIRLIKYIRDNGRQGMQSAEEVCRYAICTRVNQRSLFGYVYKQRSARSNLCTATGVGLRVGSGGTDLDRLAGRSRCWFSLRVDEARLDVAACTSATNLVQYGLSQLHLSHKQPGRKPVKHAWLGRF